MKDGDFWGLILFGSLLWGCLLGITIMQDRHFFVALFAGALIHTALTYSIAFGVKVGKEL